MPFLASEHVPLPTQDALSWMFDNPQYDQDKPIYIDAAQPSRSISCRQARQLVRRLALGLKQAGLRKEDCVCMHAFNDIYYPIACLGAVAAGGVHAGTNPAYTTSELQHHIKIAKIRFWIVEPELLPNVRAASAKTGIPESHIFAFDVHGQDVPPGIRSWNTLFSNEETDWERFDDIRRSQNTPVTRLFSSGTTGLPKAMNLSHYNCTSQHTITHEVKPRPYPIRRLVANPMFLIANVARVNFSALRMGIPIFIMRRFHLATYISNISKYSITELNVVPAMIVSLLQSNLLQKDSLSSIKQVLTGSAPLDLDLQLRFKTYLPSDATCNMTWGMSETACNGMYFYYPEQDLTGAVGRPLLNHDIKLVSVDNPQLEITTLDTRGELCIRGPSIFMGYVNPDSASLIRTDFDPDSYFHTGDIAYLSSATKLWHIVDRKKSLIKVRGFQVAPAEIEGVLLNHPEIQDVAVIGVPQAAGVGREGDGEVPRAYIVRRRMGRGVEKGGEKELGVEDVRRWIGERLARYKQVDGGVVFVDELPKNANSKVTKNVLKERARREMGGKM